MSEENVEVVRRVGEQTSAAAALVGELQLEEIAREFDRDLFVEDVELIPAREVPGRGVYRGVDGIVRFMGIWLEDFSEWSIDYERFIDAPDDRVIAIARQRAVGKGSGATVDLRFGIVNELEHGKIVRVRMYLTPEEALESVGLSQ
jgi:ketosteroid isomerase-like protein